MEETKTQEHLLMAIVRIFAVMLLCALSGVGGFFITSIVHEQATQAADILKLRDGQENIVKWINGQIEAMQQARQQQMKTQQTPPAK